MAENSDRESSRLVRLDAGNGAEVSTPAAQKETRALFGLDAEALAEVMEEAGEPKWRGGQLAKALYRQRVAEIPSISTFSKELREKLAEKGWAVGRPRIAQVFKSVDGTERYLVECGGGDRNSERQTVETVWMPEGDEGEAGDGSEDEREDKAGGRWRRAMRRSARTIGTACA